MKALRHGGDNRSSLFGRFWRRDRHSAGQSARVWQSECAHPATLQCVRFAAHDELGVCRANLVSLRTGCSEHPIRSAETTVLTETSLNLDLRQTAALQHETAIRSICCGINEVFWVSHRELWKSVCKDALTHSLCCKGVAALNAKIKPYTSHSKGQKARQIFRELL